MKRCICGDEGNADNFGSLCDSCETKRQERTARNRAVVRAAGHADSDFGRAIKA